MGKPEALGASMCLAKSEPERKVPQGTSGSLLHHQKALNSLTLISTLHSLSEGALIALFGPPKLNSASERHDYSGCKRDDPWARRYLSERER